MNRNERTYSDSAASSVGMFLAVATLILMGCRSSGLDVHLVRSATAKPGNVAVYFRVDQTDGTPVGGLKAENFKIYEDDGLISEFESKQTIVNAHPSSVQRPMAPGGAALSRDLLLSAQMQASLVTREGEVDRGPIPRVGCPVEGIEEKGPLLATRFGEVPDRHSRLRRAQWRGAAQGPSDPRLRRSRVR